jgi:hypothetical protein
VVTGVVEHLVDVVVVVDDHDREVPVTGIREAERRTLGDVDDGAAIQSVDRESPARR